MSTERHTGRTQPAENTVWRHRSRVLIAVFAVGAVTLLWRAVDLQVLHSGFLSTQAEARQVRVADIPAHRGMILDRNGDPLAVSTPVDSVWANPARLAEDMEAIQRLARVTGHDAQTLAQAVEARRDREFMYIRRHMTPDEAEVVTGLGIPSVYLQREYRRYYPMGEVAAHVLGFTNIDDSGQEGMELAFDDWLRGKSGSKRVIRDRLGRVVEDLGLVREPRPGRDLVLSIDRRVQYLAYRELKAAVSEHNARSGSLVILDAHTGEVLAMVNQPAFNPNNRATLRTPYTRNRAVSDVFEPGSAIKPFIVAAAMDAGMVDKSSRIDTSPGWMRVQNDTIRDLRNYGELSLAGVLSHSSNVGATRVAMSLSPEVLWSGLRGFGFGDVTASGFPGERSGNLTHFDRWQKIRQATLAYGYGVSVTPLQLARAYAVLASGGVMRDVSFIRVDDPPPGMPVTDAGNARALLGMLESVVTEGTGTRAAVPFYRVSGKTGTARKSGIGGYEEQRHVAVFAGTAPASDPRLVAVVVIDEPGGEHHAGGLVAAPVFSRVMSGALRLLDIAPDDVDGDKGRVAGTHLPGEPG